MKENSLIFTEKYRPSKINDIVLDSETKNKILNYLKNPLEMQSFLLYSRSPGTGKSSLAKAIIKELGCDYLLINSSDERGIDTIREKVKQFSLTKSSKEGLKRAVLLDEVDGMTGMSQDSLRNTMETYAGNVFFILTCNNINKVREAIQSRCQKIPFSYPVKDDIKIYLEKICISEKLDYTDDGIKKLVDVNYPSIRNCVVTIQDIKNMGKAIIPENIKPVNMVFDNIWDLIKKKDYFTIKKIILEGTLEARELNTFIWEKSVTEDNNKLIQITCKNEKDIAWGADAKIIFVSSIPEMLK